MSTPKRSRFDMTPHIAIPIPYRVFFLYIEPLSAIVGAYYAHLQPAAYMSLTHQPSYAQLTRSADMTGGALGMRHGMPVGVETALSQLANLYFYFALVEALVLRSTKDMKLWRTLLLCLLIADVGHLWSVKETGTFWEVYLAFWNWNEMAWGNVGFVYAGAAMRVCFLSGIGLEGSKLA